MGEYVLSPTLSMEPNMSDVTDFMALTATYKIPHRGDYPLASGRHLPLSDHDMLFTATDDGKNYIHIPIVVKYSDVSILIRCTTSEGNPAATEPYLVLFEDEVVVDAKSEIFSNVEKLLSGETVRLGGSEIGALGSWIEIALKH
jgi:hypothetical protein